MVGVIDFTKEWDGGGGEFPRIFNRTIFFDVIKDGKLTPLDDEPYDMTNAFDGKPPDDGRDADRRWRRSAAAARHGRRRTAHAGSLAWKS